jgi:hypothetical protein
MDRSPSMEYQLLETATIKVAVELGIFKLLNNEETPSPSAADIAKATRADPTLISKSFPMRARTFLTCTVGRILRCLAAWGAVKEVGNHGYSSTIVSKTFASPRNEAALEIVFRPLRPSMAQLTQTS